MIMDKTKRKVMLISMPIIDLTDAGAQKYLFDTRAIVNIPYGLLSICDYIQNYAKRKVEFKIININDKLITEYCRGNIINDVQQYFEDFVEEELRQYHPEIIGISIMFNVCYKFLDPIVARIKKIMPEATIIAGGSLATVIYDEIALRDNIDAVCYGEGEIPLLQLIESDETSLCLRNNSAFVTKETLKAGKRPQNMFVAELDSIPPIDFRRINLSNFNLPKQKGTVYKKDFAVEMVSRIIYTSRGCPYNCNFCAGFNVHGKKVRFLSIEKILRDVKKMVEHDGLTELFVCDDAFLIDKARAKTILNEFVKMKINVNFPALLMRNIDDEVAELLSKLGNTFQYTSIESGADFVLKQIIQKPISKQEAQAAANSLRKFGISVLTNIVVGSPGETDEHRKETLETLYNIGFSWVFIMIALPVPGSPLYKECEEKGYLVNKFFTSPSLTRCNIRTPSYSPEHIEWQAYMMNLYINFVHNYNLRIGNYDECIASFTNVIKSYPDHAFAYFGLMQAYEGKRENSLALESKYKFEELTNKSTKWQDWAVYFKLSDKCSGLRQERVA
jgi:anaerobic magnesium-protoporphyrin IX monomethyl ester cyclase